MVPLIGSKRVGGRAERQAVGAVAGFHEDAVIGGEVRVDKEPETVGAETAGRVGGEGLDVGRSGGDERPKREGERGGAFRGVGGEGGAVEKLGHVSVAGGVGGAVLEGPAEQQGGVCAGVNAAAGGETRVETLRQTVADDVADS